MDILTITIELLETEKSSWVHHADPCFLSLVNYNWTRTQCPCISLILALPLICRRVLLQALVDKATEPEPQRRSAATTID